MEIHAVSKYVFSVHAGSVSLDAEDTVLKNIDIVSVLQSSQTIKNNKGYEGRKLGRLDRM